MKLSFDELADRIHALFGLTLCLVFVLVALAGARGVFYLYFGF